eukprot:254544_1
MLSALGIFLLVLATNDDVRSRIFVNMAVSQNLRGTPLDEHRCSILEEGRVTGKVMEFGPGPGTNFKCFQNSTTIDSQSIEKYVVVEPNSYFEKEMRKQLDVRGLDFPLEFVGIKGEDVDIGASDVVTFDVVIMTHVLCSVDSTESVLANAERALKKGGRIIFMEHVNADKNRQLFIWLVQRVAAPILNIVGNGCTFRNLGSEIEDYLGDRFDTQMTEFEVDAPWFMYFAKPHVKGVAIKR